MSDAIYNDAILSLAKSNLGMERLAAPKGSATCDNPLCGDRVTIDLNIENDRISEITQRARGCILTKAAAALVVDLAADMPTDDLALFRQQLRAYLRSESDDPPDQKLGMFQPVRNVKSRHECILIALDALVAAAEQARNR